MNPEIFRSHIGSREVIAVFGRCVHVYKVSERMAEAAVLLHEIDVVDIVGSSLPQNMKEEFDLLQLWQEKGLKPGTASGSLVIEGDYRASRFEHNGSNGAYMTRRGLEILALGLLMGNTSIDEGA